MPDKPPNDEDKNKSPEELIANLQLASNVMMNHALTYEKSLYGRIFHTFMPSEPDVSFSNPRIQDYRPGSDLTSKDTILDATDFDEKANISSQIEFMTGDKPFDLVRLRQYIAHGLARTVEKGQDYKEASEHYVIMIEERDRFGLGRPVYEPRPMVHGVDIFAAMKLHIIFVNGTHRGDDAYGRLCHDLYAHRLEDMLDEELKRIAAHLKTPGKEGYQVVCREIVEYAQDFAEDYFNANAPKFAEDYAKNVVRQKELKTIASCLKLSLPMETIAAVTGLTQEELAERLSELALSASLTS